MSEQEKIPAHPWLVAESIPVIEKLLTAKSKVLEFGAGGSTLWFAQMVDEVVSVENSITWFKRVVAQISDNVWLTREEPPYTRFLAGLPPHYFDLVLVDGRRRCDCMIASYKSIKPGGYLVLDNSEREDYAPGINFLTDNGMKPVGRFISRVAEPYPGWTTEIFRKPK